MDVESDNEDDVEVKQIKRVLPAAIQTCPKRYGSANIYVHKLQAKKCD